MDLFPCPLAVGVQTLAASEISRAAARALRDKAGTVVHFAQELLFREVAIAAFLSRAASPRSPNSAEIRSIGWMGGSALPSELASCESRGHQASQERAGIVDASYQAPIHCCLGFAAFPAFAQNRSPLSFTLAAPVDYSRPDAGTFELPL